MSKKPVRPLIDNGDGTFTVILTKGKTCLISKESVDKVKDYNWCYNISGDKRSGYACTLINHKFIRLHRHILNITDEREVDHIDGNTVNNQLNNLRLCNRNENNRNRKKSANRSSKYKGVCYTVNTNKWRARIRIAGNHVQLGYFTCEKDAAVAYNKAAKKYFGEFAKLNIIEEENKDAA